MIKKLIFIFLIISIAITFFSYKGWITVTPEGKEAAVESLDIAKETVTDLSVHAYNYTKEKMHERMESTKNR